MRNKLLVRFLKRCFLTLLIVFTCNISISYSTQAVKCEDFFDGIAPSGFDVNEYCEKNEFTLPLINNTNRNSSFIPSNGDAVSYIRGEDDMIPITCSPPQVGYSRDPDHQLELPITKEIKLCGDDWNSFAFDYDEVKDIPFEKWYPKYGAFNNSYAYKLDKTLKNEYSCEDFLSLSSNKKFKTFNSTAKNCLLSDIAFNSENCSDFKEKCFPILPLLDSGGYCNMEGSNVYSQEYLCNNVSSFSKNIKNRIYREFLYGGKEISMPLSQTVQVSVGKCYDPRIDSSKGFTGVEQRYYFKGREAANYACDRFFFSDDSCVNAKGEIITDKSECEKFFKEARDCCSYREESSACIYREKTENKTLINGNIVNKINDNGLVEGGREDNFYLCKLNSGANTGRCGLVIGDENYFFELYLKKLDDDSKITDEKNEICVSRLMYSGNQLKSKINIFEGTEVKDLYCGGDHENCVNPYETGGICPIDNGECEKWDLYYKDDFSKIWQENNGKVEVLSHFKKPKNFCTFNAHCVKISEPGPVSYSNIPKSIINENRFSPIACYDTKGDSKNTKYKVLAPYIECIVETINNMFLGEAGVSSCRDPDESINSEGLCGEDSFSDPSSIRSETYNPEYSGDFDAYNYIKGGKLPDQFNAFKKFQSSVKSIISVGVMLFIVIGSANFLIKGELNILGDVKKVKGVIFNLVKITLIFYFAIGNAWQGFFHAAVMDSAGFIYSKVFEYSSGYSDYKKVEGYAICDSVDTVEISQLQDRAFYCDVKKTKTTCDATCDFDTSTPGEYTYKVDPNKNIEYLYMKIWGASSGTNNYDGRGGYTYGRYKVHPDLNELYAYVGGMSSRTKDVCGEEFGSPGFNGGGRGGRGWSTNQGIGGGGASDIRTIKLNGNKNNEFKSLSSRFLVAGGGGGRYENSVAGGSGGGGNSLGTAGFDSGSMGCYGYGGTLTAGGLGGNCEKCTSEEIALTPIYPWRCVNLDSKDCTNTSGSFGYGGNGRKDNHYAGGAGGGGGYYGGGAGSSSSLWDGRSSGGGGSGFILDTVVDLSGGETGVNLGPGRIKICYSAENSCVTEDILNNKKLLIQNIDEYEIDFTEGGVTKIQESSQEIDTEYGDKKIENIEMEYSNCFIKEGETNFKIINYGEINEKENVEVLLSDLPNTFTSSGEYVVAGATYKEEIYTAEREKISVITKKSKIYSNCVEAGTKTTFDRGYDGCFFGDEIYPFGKEYLAIFDSFDCKLVAYLDVVFGNLSGGSKVIIVLFLTGFFNPAIVMIFFLFLTTFVFIAILAFKLMYIFIVNISAINVLIFVSPLILPLYLFPKHKKIASGWMETLIGYLLQLIILVIFAGFMLSSLDSFALHTAYYDFHDPITGRNPTLICPTDSITNGFLCYFDGLRTDTIDLAKILFGWLVGGEFFLWLFDLEWKISYWGADQWEKLWTSIPNVVTFLLAGILFTQIFDKIPALAKTITTGSAGLQAQYGISNAVSDARKYTKPISRITPILHKTGNAVYRGIRGKVRVKKRDRGEF